MAQKDQARMVGSVALTLAALTVAGLAYPLQAGGTKSDSKVKATAAARPAAGGKQTVTVTLDISKGWHLYANPVGNEDLEAAKTVIQVAGKDKDAVQVQYPAGKAIKDKVVGEYKIYEGNVTIPVVVQRDAAETGPLEVVVRFQACDERTCLQPATVKLKVQ